MIEKAVFQSLGDLLCPDWVHTVAGFRGGGLVWVFSQPCSAPRHPLWELPRRSLLSVAYRPVAFWWGLHGVLLQALEAQPHIRPFWLRPARQGGLLSQGGQPSPSFSRAAAFSGESRLLAAAAPSSVGPGVGLVVAPGHEGCSHSHERLVWGAPGARVSPRRLTKVEEGVAVW